MVHFMVTKDMCSSKFFFHHHLLFIFLYKKNVKSIIKFPDKILILYFPLWSLQVGIKGFTVTKNWNALWKLYTVQYTCPEIFYYKMFRTACTIKLNRINLVLIFIMVPPGNDNGIYNNSDNMRLLNLQ
jgi:hypothetical protein